MEEPKKYWTQKANELKKAGKFEKAVKALDKIKEIEKDEQQEDYWYKRAVQYYEIGDYEEGKNAIYRDFEIGNKSFNHFFLLGKILHSLEKNEEAIESLNKASEEYARKRLRSSIKIDQMKNVRKFEEAVRYSKEVFQEKDLDSEYWHLKGLILFKLKKFDKASSCFEIALQTNERDINLQYDYAKSEAWRENQDKALEILKKIFSKEPSVKERLKEDKEFEMIKENQLF